MADRQWLRHIMPSTYFFPPVVGVAGGRAPLQRTLLLPSPAAGSEAQRAEDGSGEVSLWLGPVAGVGESAVGQGDLQ